MTTDHQIKDGKLQYDINTEAVKISVLSSGKINNYEYLTGEEIWPSNQKQIIELAKLTYYPLGKVFEKQTKTIEDQGKSDVLKEKAMLLNKKVDALKDLTLESQTKTIEGILQKYHESDEIENKLHKIKRYENNISKIKTQKRA